MYKHAHYISGCSAEMFHFQFVRRNGDVLLCLILSLALLLSRASSSSAAQTMVTINEKLEQVLCNTVLALGQPLASWEGWVLITEELFIPESSLHDSLWGTQKKIFEVCLCRCFIFSEFLPSSLHLICLRDLGWVKTEK